MIYYRMPNNNMFYYFQRKTPCKNPETGRLKKFNKTFYRFSY